MVQRSMAPRIKALGHGTAIEQHIICSSGFIESNNGKANSGYGWVHFFIKKKCFQNVKTRTLALCDRFQDSMFFLKHDSLSSIIPEQDVDSNY